VKVARNYGITHITITSGGRHVCLAGWQEGQVELVQLTARTPEALIKKVANWIKQPDKDTPTWDECGNHAPVERGDPDIETEPLPDETLVEYYFNWYEQEFSLERFECIVEDDPKILETAIRDARADDLIGGAISKENRIVALRRCLAGLSG
jgi:hypothetical protein